MLRDFMPAKTGIFAGPAKTKRLPGSPSLAWELWDRYPDLQAEGRSEVSVYVGGGCTVAYKIGFPLSRNFCPT
jgi:hypothetical protein